MPPKYLSHVGEKTPKVSQEIVYSTSSIPLLVTTKGHDFFPSHGQNITSSSLILYSTSVLLEDFLTCLLSSVCSAFTYESVRLIMSRVVTRLAQVRPNVGTTFPEWPYKLFPITEVTCNKS